jgi:UDP-glucose 4-epimerase
MSRNHSRRIVVLGARGFLGSNVTRHLAAAGHQVTAYWRKSRTDLLHFPNLTSVVGDLRDLPCLSNAIKDADVVYHFASSTHPSRFFDDPAEEYSEALAPLIGLMNIASANGVRKIVFPSSGGTIYADSDRARSEVSPIDPRTPYAVSKVAAEQLLLHASRQRQFSVDVYRIGNPYGPGQRPRPGHGVIPHWIEAIRNRQPVQLFGDGSAARDYVYVDDLCRLMALSCDRLAQSDLFNLGTGTATSLTSLLEHVLELVGHDCPVERLPSRASDIHSVALSPTRLLRLAPDFQFTPLRWGLAQTLADRGLAGGWPERKAA